MACITAVYYFAGKDQRLRRRNTRIMLVRPSCIKDKEREEIPTLGLSAPLQLISGEEDEGKQAREINLNELHNPDDETKNCHKIKQNRIFHHSSQIIIGTLNLSKGWQPVLRLEASYGKLSPAQGKNKLQVQGGLVKKHTVSSGKQIIRRHVLCRPTSAEFEISKALH